VFDGLEGLPRLLKSRSGHQAAPTSIRHYGDCGNNILSGGGNDKTIRSFSVIRDSQSVELSQGSLAKKAAKKNVSLDYMRLPPILQFGHATLKEKDWDNIVTCHSNASTARVWSFDRKAIGQHVLKSPDDSNIKAVAMSQCGNHAFVGSAMGNIAQYNMQSGLFKMKYIGHEKPISSMCTDSLSQRLFSSSLDGRVKVWNIKSGKLITTLDFKTPISRILIHLESGLLAVVADDLCIRVVDTDTFTIVREFYGHRNRILDLVCDFLSLTT
jgi:U3 small nucleolar RNA-associated protein 21